MLQHLEGRCCSAEYDRNVQVFGPGDGKVACRVTQALLLLEGVIVFFIDNDQPRVFERRENGGASANDQAG